MVQIEYLRDESLYVGNCEEVIRVKSTEDIQSLINKDIFITAQGNRTGIAGAAVPEGGAVLSFAFAPSYKSELQVLITRSSIFKPPKISAFWES